MLNVVEYGDRGVDHLLNPHLHGRLNPSLKSQPQRLPYPSKPILKEEDKETSMNGSFCQERAGRMAERSEGI